MSVSPDSRIRGLVAAFCFALLLTVAVLPPAAATPAPAPATTSGAAAPEAGGADCPHRVNPPPAVDDSEVVQSWETTPTPLPVPDTPVGGERLGGCEVVADPGNGPLPADLTSQGWLIADATNGTVIAARDPHGRYRPASTIKILLALVALEELDLDQKVQPTERDWSMEGDSCGMGPGGEYTLRDVLSGLMVVSGNDCANLLARELGGYDETLAKMNAKAHSIGALDTNAASPSGLDRPGMSTSPYDLAVIFNAGLHNPEFVELIGLEEYVFPGYPSRTDVPDDTDHPEWTMANSNPLLLSDFPGMIGGKTGYTDDALKTYVAAAERDGRTIIVVQMYGLSVENNMYSDQAARMFEYGFASDPNLSVGRLDTPDEGWVAAGGADPSAAPAGGNDDSPGVASWIIIGGIGVLAVLALVVAHVRKARRRTRGDDSCCH